MEDHVYERPLKRSTVIDQLLSVPPLDWLLFESSRPLSVHVPLGFPVKVLKAFSGLNVPVKGADPAEIGFAAASEKTVVTILSKFEPLSAIRQIDPPTVIVFLKPPFELVESDPPGR